jgi:hypothetical protein
MSVKHLVTKPSFADDEHHEWPDFRALFGNAIVNNAFVFNHVESSASIWLPDPSPGPSTGQESGDSADQ